MAGQVAKTRFPDISQYHKLHPGRLGGALHKTLTAAHADDADEIFCHGLSS
tara:strand:+ start:392 stop:544 length:153 start_codon:yes stop_codon:yes gene_type:complete